MGTPPPRVLGLHMLSTGDHCMQCKCCCCSPELATISRWLLSEIQILPQTYGKTEPTEECEQNQVNKSYSRPQESKSSPGNGCFTHWRRLYKSSASLTTQETSQYVQVWFRNAISFKSQKLGEENKMVISQSLACFSSIPKAFLLRKKESTE